MIYSGVDIPDSKIPVSSASSTIPLISAKALSNGMMLSKKTLAVKDQPTALVPKDQMLLGEAGVSYIVNHLGDT